MLDPLDVHWTALIPLSKDGPEGLRKQSDVFAAGTGWQWKALMSVSLCRPGIAGI